MNDRDTIVKSLKQCIEDDSCDRCAYRKRRKCYDALMYDAMIMLEGRKPVKALANGDDSYVCENCGETVGWEELDVFGIDPVKYKYCPGCGRAVDWNG